MYLASPLSEMLQYDKSRYSM